MPPRVVGVNEPAGPDVSSFRVQKGKANESVITRDTMTRRAA